MDIYDGLNLKYMPIVCFFRINLGRVRKFGGFLHIAGCDNLQTPKTPETQRKTQT